MKTLKRLLRFILNLFRRNQNVKLSKTTIEERFEAPKLFQKKLGHGKAFNNNRKRTKGRNIQEIKMGEKSKFIFHEN